MTDTFTGANGVEGISDIQGVIFDMDGLMFDTQVVWDRLWTPALAAFGLTPTTAFIAQARGTTGDATYAAIRRNFGADAPAEAIYLKLRDFATQEFAAHPVPIKPGLRELLDYLRKREIPRAVASSSPKQMILTNLRNTGINDYFKETCVVCGQDVTRSKPAPDIFLEATHRLGTDPAHTIVLEDSYQGVRAGATGGFITIMVPDLLQPTDEIRGLCAKVCHTLAEVIPYIEGDDAPSAQAKNKEAGQ